MRPLGQDDSAAPKVDSGHADTACQCNRAMQLDIAVCGGNIDPVPVEMGVHELKERPSLKEAAAGFPDDVGGRVGRNVKHHRT